MNERNETEYVIKQTQSKPKLLINSLVLPIVRPINPQEIKLYQKKKSYQ